MKIKFLNFNFFKNNKKTKVEKRSKHIFNIEMITPASVLANHYLDLMSNNYFANEGVSEIGDDYVPSKTYKK